MRRTARYAWAWRLCDFHFRLALFFSHRYPKGHEARRQMADCILRVRLRSHAGRVG
jgi:hypothetical protein